LGFHIEQFPIGGRKPRPAMTLVLHAIGAWKCPDAPRCALRLANLLLLAQDRAMRTIAFGVLPAVLMSLQQASAGPSVVSISPASGSGMSERFTFSLHDTSGADHVSWMNVMIPSAGTKKACWIAYEHASRTISLAADGASSWSYTPMGSGSVENSQCIVNGTQSSVSSSGQVLTVNLALTFKPEFAGFKTLHVRVINRSGVIADYAPKGTWDAFGASQSPMARAPQTTLPAGAHWANPEDFSTLVRSTGAQFAVLNVAPGDVAQRRRIFDAAQQTGIKLIMGAEPSPYTLNPDGTWSISVEGISFLNDLAAHSSVVQAVFVFNEPYWYSMRSHQTDICGGTTAAELRALRTHIQSIWPQAKIYHDLGDPEGWTKGGSVWRPCVGAKFEDQTGVADYVGIWNYPFDKNTFHRQAALDFAYRGSRFVTENMRAIPVMLAQSHGCTTAACGGKVDAVMPTPSQMNDLNCSFRRILPPGSLISWYVWRQALYTDQLANHPELWPFVGAAMCATSP
jgi:hypothetical protein